MIIQRYGNYWAVWDVESTGEFRGRHTPEIMDRLVCITVYKKGATEVVRRLQTKAINEA